MAAIFTVFFLMLIRLTALILKQILDLHPRDGTAMLVFQTIENGPQILHNNRVKFPKHILLPCSANQNGRRTRQMQTINILSKFAHRSEARKAY